MKEKNFLWLLGMLFGLTCPVNAEANEIDIQTRQMRIYRSPEGDTYINTDRIQIDPTVERSPRPYYRSNPSRERFYRDRCISRQESRQTNHQGYIRQTTRFSSYCR